MEIISCHSKAVLFVFIYLSCEWHHMNELHFKTILKVTLNGKISQYYCFWSNKCSLGEQESLFKNMQKIVSTPNFDH